MSSLHDKGVVGGANWCVGGCERLAEGWGGGGMVISVNMLCKNIFDIVNVVISFLLQCL